MYAIIRWRSPCSIPNALSCIQQLNNTSEALNWIMKAMSGNNMGKGKPPLLKTEEDETSRQQVIDEEEKLFNQWKAKKNNIVHVKCRASPYIKASKVRRFPIPNTKLYWEVNHKPEYLNICTIDKFIPLICLKLNHPYKNTIPLILDWMEGLSAIQIHSWRDLDRQLGLRRSRHFQNVSYSNLVLQI